MDLGLQDKVAWITGGSSGIGRACALSLAREGARIALSARTEGPLVEAARSIEDETGSRCLPVPLDVADSGAIPAAAARIAAELGAVDILLANAGGPPPGPFLDLGDDALTSGFETTVASAWRLARAVVPGMVERGGGCLMFITSSSAKELIHGLLVSNMMRPAVTGLAKTLSKELGPHGIRTVAIAPGRIDTPRTQTLNEARAASSGRPLEEVQASAVSDIPLGRYGSAGEVGDVVAFLASERATYVTGVTVLVDGGLLDGILS